MSSAVLMAFCATWCWQSSWVVLKFENKDKCEIARQAFSDTLDVRYKCIDGVAP